MKSYNNLIAFNLLSGQLKLVLSGQLKLTTPRGGRFRDNETNNPNEHNRVKNPNWFNNHRRLCRNVGRCKDSMKKNN